MNHGSGFPRHGRWMVALPVALGIGCGGGPRSGDSGPGPIRPASRTRHRSGPTADCRGRILGRLRTARRTRAHAERARQGRHGVSPDEPIHGRAPGRRPDRRRPTTSTPKPITAACSRRSARGDLAGRASNSPGTGSSPSPKREAGRRARLSRFRAAPTLPEAHIPDSQRAERDRRAPLPGLQR